MKARKESCSGFSLFEILIVSALVGFVTLGVSFFLYNKTLEQNDAKTRSDAMSSAALLVSALRKEVQHAVSVFTVGNLDLNRSNSLSGDGFIREFRFERLSDAGQEPVVLAFFLAERASLGAVPGTTRSQLAPRALVFVPPQATRPGQLRLVFGTGQDLQLTDQDILLNGVVGIELTNIQALSSGSVISADLRFSWKSPGTTPQMNQLRWCPPLDQQLPACQIPGGIDTMAIDSVRIGLTFYNVRRRMAIPGFEYPLGFYLFRSL